MYSDNNKHTDSLIIVLLLTPLFACMKIKGPFPRPTFFVRLGIKTEYKDLVGRKVWRVYNLSNRVGRFKEKVGRVEQCPTFWLG